MTIIRLERQIPATPAAVYDFVTRPARWKEWHPASRGADAHAMQSLPAGAKFEEDIRSAGFLRHLSWCVVEAIPGVRWAAYAVMDDGSRVSLLYEFSESPAGTRFVRTLDYQLKPWLLYRLNKLFMWRRVEHESNRALDNLVKAFASLTPAAGRAAS